jgi:hypothetical protein
MNIFAGDFAFILFSVLCFYHILNNWQFSGLLLEVFYRGMSAIALGRSSSNFPASSLSFTISMAIACYEQSKIILLV